MNIALIGRTEILFNTGNAIFKKGHNIVCIITAKETDEYTKSSNDFHSLASKLGISFIHSSKILDAKTLLEEAKPDIGISMNYPGIIPKSIIELFPLGILNAHGGDLPRYRGNACQAWAIINGEEKIGLCIHKMIGDELDSGDIIARDYFPISQNTKVTDCWEWMASQVPLLFIEAIEKLEKNADYVLEKQSSVSKNILRCYPRKYEDGKINWSKSSQEILRLINATNKPYKGAFCEYEGITMTIWDAELYNDGENYLAIPGQISEIQNLNGSAIVITGNGKLKLNLIEYNGNRCFPADIIKSIRSRLA